MHIFMRWGDANIPGLTTEAGYEKWVKLDSVAWGCSGSPIGGLATSRERWAQQFDLVECRRRADLMSREMIGDGLKAKPGLTVEIHFARTWHDGDPLDVFLAFTLSKVWLDSYDITATNGDWPVERFGIAYGAIQVRQWTLDRAAARKVMVGTISHDLAQG